MAEKKPRILSAKEEAFCVAVAAGKSVAEAYYEIYDTKKTFKKCYNDAYTVYRKEGVKKRIRDALMDRYAPFVLKQEDRIRVLSDTVLTGGTKDALRAIDILNKMDGSYTEKIEVTSKSTITVYLPQRRSPNVVQ